LTGQCDFLEKFPTEDGVAQLVVEDEDGPEELVDDDERLERKRKWPRYSESASERLNPERDESLPGMGLKSWLAAKKGWRGSADGRGPARGRRRLNPNRSRAVTWWREESHMVSVDWESSIISLDCWSFMAYSPRWQKKEEEQSGRRERRENPGFFFIIIIVKKVLSKDRKLL
jgi:hypothetical protein